MMPTISDPAAYLPIALFSTSFPFSSSLLVVTNIYIHSILNDKVVYEMFIKLFVLQSTLHIKMLSFNISESQLHIKLTLRR